MSQLLGRPDERAALDALLTGARDGRSAALLVVGEPGIGKSALLRHAAGRAGDFQLLVLRARGYETEADLAFSGLLDLLTPVLGHRSRIPGVQAAALEGAFALAPPAGADRFAVPAGVLSLLAAAAEERPVLALVDDVQWLDQASREALAFVARRLAAEGVVLLLAARPGEGAEEAFAGVDVLELGPLDPDSAHELVVREGSASGPLADAVCERLVATAAGNPLALVELPRALTPGQRTGREPITAPLPPAPAVERRFAAQVDALPDGTRLALLAAAALESSSTQVLAVALGSLGLFADVLAPAERAGLVRVADHVEFAHPLLRSTVYHRASADQRRHVHRALAEAATDARRRAWHLAAATTAPDEAVAAALEAAAVDARARGGQGAAAQAFARAAELSPAAADRGRRRLEAASDFVGAGFPDQALALLDAAEDETDDPLLLADLRRVRGGVELRRGTPGVAGRLLRPEAERVRDLDPGRAATLMVEAAVSHMTTGDMDALIADAEVARELAAGGVAPVVEVFATVLIAEALAALGDEERADAMLEPLVGPILASDLVHAPAEVIGMIGHCSIWTGRFDRAEAVLDALVAAGRDASAVANLIYPLAAHAQLDLRRGRWQAALADADESVRLGRATGNLAFLAFSLATLAQVEASFGRGDEAQAHAKEALALTEASEGDATSAYALHALGLDALGRGDAELAAEWLTRCARVSQNLRMQRAIVPHGADRVEALARAGRTGQAHEALEQFADRLGGGRWATAALARCRGILAGADYEDHFETALAHHEHDGQPWEKARTLLCYGERLRRDRRRADARELLAEALATFERLGSAPWAERARVELRATGSASAPAASAEPALAAEPTPAALAAAGLDELTPHELQIARLVAYGMTNREVAAKLFLSPKTIEYHLSAIYRKLELRSRTQLAKLLASELPAAVAA